MAERWQDEAWDARHVVERQDDPSALPRPLRGGGGSPRRDDAGPGSVAGGVRPGQAVQARHAPAPVGDGGVAAARRRWSASRWRWTGSTRAAGSAAGRSSCCRRLRVEARRRPAQGGEARRRGPDRRPCGRLPLQRVPRLHAGVRGQQGRQHDHGVPRHHDHPEQVQPLHVPPVRLRAFAGGRRGAVHGRQDRQAVAHRLRRLRLGPVHEGRVRRRGPEERRRGRGDDRHPARHRGHDAFPQQDHAGRSTGSSGSSSAPRASPSSPRASTWASARSTASPATGPSRSPRPCRRSGARGRASSASTATSR